MQNSIDCADRNTERSGDFFDSTSFGRVVHRVRVKTRSTRAMVRPFRADAQSSCPGSIVRLWCKY
jgi:hypothetical protein